MSLLVQFGQDKVLRVRINDPAHGNSFSLSIARELDVALRSQQILGLELSSTGRLFCAGGNLSQYAKMNRNSEGLRANREIGRVLDRVHQLKVPTVCVVQGDCFGGGVEVISSFDHVVAVPEALLGLWQRRIALSFGWGGGKRLLQRLSMQRLRTLALESRCLSAYEAQSAGLVDAVVLSSCLPDYLVNYWRALLALPQEPVAGIKAVTAKNEQKVFSSLWWSQAHREILARRRR